MQPSGCNDGSATQVLMEVLHKSIALGVMMEEQCAR